MATNGDFDQLRDWAIAGGLIAPDANWVRMRPGLTNIAWRIEDPQNDPLVLKLFRPHQATPLFPNDAAAEWTALTSLAGTGLAPKPLGAAASPSGPIVLYRYIASHGPADLSQAAVALKQLHGRSSAPGFREVTLDAAAILKTGDDLIPDCQSPLRDRLAECRPSAAPPSTRRRDVFLHGDPVPSNTLRTAGGAVFIDWQCPARGDPVFDIACALSPSMRISCGEPPATEDEIEDFLNAYDDAQTTRIFQDWRPTLAWRFACYAAWRIGQGHGTAARGLAAELALLERLGQQNQ